MMQLVDRRREFNKDLGVGPACLAGNGDLRRKPGRQVQGHKDHAAVRAPESPFARALAAGRAARRRPPLASLTPGPCIACQWMHIEIE